MEGEERLVGVDEWMWMQMGDGRGLDNEGVVGGMLFGWVWGWVQLWL